MGLPRGDFSAQNPAILDRACWMLAEQTADALRGVRDLILRKLLGCAESLSHFWVNRHWAARHCLALLGFGQS